MEISGKEPLINLNAYIKNAQGSGKTEKICEKPKDTSGPEDKVELSDRANELKQAIRAVKAMPEIRQEKVEQIQNQLSQGTYKVEGQKIAINMISESLVNSGILNKIDTTV